MGALNFQNIDSMQHLYQECPDTLLARLEQQLGYSNDEARIAWAELQRFLFVCGQADESLSPSKRIDEVWHEAILHTRDYASLCIALCGHFIHHIPMDKPDRKAYLRTLASLKKYFGPLDEKYWPSKHLVLASCGGKCGSSCKS